MYCALSDSKIGFTVWLPSNACAFNKIGFTVCLPSNACAFNLLQNQSVPYISLFSYQLLSLPMSPFWISEYHFYLRIWVYLSLISQEICYLFYSVFTLFVFLSLFCFNPFLHISVFLCFVPLNLRQSNLLWTISSFILLSPPCFVLMAWPLELVNGGHYGYLAWSPWIANGHTINNRRCFELQFWSCSLFQKMDRICFRN